MGIVKTVNKKTHYIHILGSRWKIVFWCPAHYAKHVAVDSKGELTDYDRRILHIDLNHLSGELLRHELTHAYAKERSIVELSIKTVDQSEEFFAELNGKHAEVLCKQAKQLCQFARKLKWKKSL